MPPKPWKTLSSREVYKNPWTRVREDLAEMPNGQTTIYGVIECGHCVGVLPFLDDDHVVMVRQYRYNRKLSKTKRRMGFSRKTGKHRNCPD